MSSVRCSKCDFTGATSGTQLGVGNRSTAFRRPVNSPPPPPHTQTHTLYLLFYFHLGQFELFLLTPVSNRNQTAQTPGKAAMPPVVLTVTQLFFQPASSPKKTDSHNKPTHSVQNSYSLQGPYTQGNREAQNGWWGKEKRGLCFGVHATYLEH